MGVVVRTMSVDSCKVHAYHILRRSSVDRVVMPASPATSRTQRNIAQQQVPAANSHNNYSCPDKQIYGLQKTGRTTCRRGAGHGNQTSVKPGCMYSPIVTSLRIKIRSLHTKWHGTTAACVCSYRSWRHTEFQKIHKRGFHFPTSPHGAIKR